MARPPAKLAPWRKMIDAVINPKETVRIGVIGKYSELQDAYKSLYEAIAHGGIARRPGRDVMSCAAVAVAAAASSTTRAISVVTREKREADRSSAGRYVERDPLVACG